MLILNPLNRIKAKDALQYPYFKDFKQWYLKILIKNRKNK
jgi:hypothetical protein